MQKDSQLVKHNLNQLFIKWRSQKRNYSKISQSTDPTGTEHGHKLWIFLHLWQLYCFLAFKYPTLSPNAQPHLGDNTRNCINSGLFKQSLWMKHYGHLCLKRTLLWSTSRAIQYLDLGPIQKTKHRSLVKTAVKYKDKSGKTRYKGAGSALKGTQFLLCSHWFAV